MNADQPRTQIPLERWEILLRALGERVAAASESHSTVRCWKPSTLVSEIAAAIRTNRAALLTTFPPAHEVIEHLKRTGWLQPIKVQSSGGTTPIEFLLVDMGAAASQPISPLELLQAYLPAGTICYFSALAHYELTTQTAPHHHIARLNPPRPRKNAVEAPAPEEGERAFDRNPLGTEIFRFDNVP